MIVLRDGVSLVGLHPQLIIALANANELYTNRGVHSLVVTSARDGYSHAYTSLHWSGGAVDIRTKSLPNSATKIEVLQALKDSLGVDFDVLLEYLDEPNEHIHIEYQPKRPTLKVSYGQKPDTQDKV